MKYNRVDTTQGETQRCGDEHAKRVSGGRGARCSYGRCAARHINKNETKMRVLWGKGGRKG